MRILVTGGAGFIGSAVVRYLIESTDFEVLNVDKLTYAGNEASLAAVADSPRYQFARIDICDRGVLEDAFDGFAPTAVMHLAAESHVDRSIDGPDAFVRTNLFGTYNLLEAARRHWAGRPNADRCRFLHISTDEVYGDLGDSTDPFDEETPYDPSSPYSATKAGSDHLVRAWGRTYGLPVLITNCSNNYGPYQFPEKLIPHMILNALAGQPLPVYGDGKQVRDWLYVEDHAEALLQVLTTGRSGETYNIGGHNEKRNIEVVHTICAILDEEWTARPQHLSLRALITFVRDRPGHDTRYAINAGKVERELGWRPRETFESGLRKTIRWYLANEGWWKPLLDGNYRLHRIGLKNTAG